MNRTQQLMEQFQMNIENVAKGRQEIYAFHEKEDFGAVFGSNVAMMTKIFSENSEIVVELYHILEHELDEENAILLADFAYKMARNYSDEYDVLLKLCEILIPYFRKKCDLIHLLKLYYVQFYEKNEVKNRYFSVTQYDFSALDEMLKLEDHYFEIEDVKDRALIWDAYYLKIAFGLANKTLSARAALHLYYEMMEKWNEPKVQELDGKDPVCSDYIQSVRKSIPLALYTMEHEDDETKALFCRLVKGLYFSVLQDGVEEIMIDPILYASHLYVLYLQSEETLEEIFNSLLDYYKVRVKEYQEEESLSYKGLEFMINVTELLAMWAEKGIGSEVIRKMVSSFMVLAETRWKQVDNEKVPVLNELMKQLCNYIIRYTTSEEDEEKYVQKMIIQRNFFTYLHSKQITRLSLLIFKEAYDKMPSLFMQYSIWGYNKLEDFVKKSAIFHDIGVIDMIPVMYTKLHEHTEEEIELIKQHPSIGAKYVDKIDGMAKYKEIILGHHKDYDGKGGFPEGYDNTHAWNRIIVDIIHLADEIDSLFDPFLQKGNNVSFEHILGILHQGKGTKYNPMMVEIIEASPSLQQDLYMAVGPDKYKLLYEYYNEMDEVMHPVEFDILVDEIAEKLKNLSSSSDYDELRPYLDRLFEGAAREHSDRSFGIAYYYTMRYHMLKQEFMNGINCGMEAVRYLEKTDEFRNLCAIHNSIGICMQCQGNVENAVGEFLTCAEYAQMSQNDSMEGIAYNNAASIFREVELYEKAIEYYEKAEACLVEKKVYKLNICYNMLYCYIGLNDREQVERLWEKVRKIKETLTEEEDYSSFVSNVYEAYTANYLGNRELVEYYLECIRNNLQVFDDYRLYIEEIYVYLDLLEQMERFDELTKQLDVYIEYCKENHVSHYIFNSFLQKRIMCAYRVDDFELAKQISGYLGKVIDDQVISRADVALQIENTYLKDVKHQRTQQELLRENEQLEIEVKATKNATAAKTAFLSSMSHEIRTPIHAVLGLDEMILRESHEDHILQYAKDIQTAGNTLLSIVNDVLDFSKMEAGKIEIIQEKYSMDTMLHEIYNMMCNRAKEKNLEYHVQCAEEMPKILYGDNVRIKQILLNLISNAIKYTHEGSVHLSVSYQVQTKNLIQIHFSIRDTGIGIKEEEISKLMQPFERIDENRNRSIAGTGLGMSIVSMLINEMNGKLIVDSEYGKGSEFVVELSQEVIDWTPIGTLVFKKQSAAKEKESVLFAPEAKILLVDDNAVNLKVVCNLLKRTAIQVTTARSGQECLEKAKENRYHLILLDHQMPEMDGIQTLQHLKEMHGINEQTPVIALTANNMANAMEFYQSAGFDDFLSKPVDVIIMEQKIKSYLPEDLQKEK